MVTFIDDHDMPSMPETGAVNPIRSSAVNL
jgi:hypothetical protein